ncbi:hypothetical protein MIND_00083400 [Mycena indigotica]|uniref:DUF7727 domain-containing protein n=1 Tax=Mycena indigotica TaxID=2126181 RepID=A0A8H6WI23_9AGAR|nr:uncharacterized protein MIND_00083400 [Mycena indigotica]KAF7315678.1 hypothetical protein MIND_00083400 [Mycena indigotica]
MASSFNLTIDDSSPLVSYGPSGAWQDASSKDTAGLAYTGGTIHTTTTRGATATIQFNGTGIEIYGSHRPSFGGYELSVDGKLITTGRSSSPGFEIQQLLGSATGLSNGPHTAVLTSTGVGMDIDWANVITQVGGAGSAVTTTVFDDANSAMNYAGNWATTNTDKYINGTLHYTQSPGSAASLQFVGNAVAIYGTVSPNHANMQVSIDGRPTLVNIPSSTISGLHAQTLLYYANNLDSSQHMLIITNPGQQSGTGSFIDLDSITVYSASTTAGDAAPISNQASASTTSGIPQPRPKSGLAVGAIVGIVLTVILLVLGLLGLMLFLGARRRRRRADRNNLADPSTPVDAELPLQSGNIKLSPDTPIQPMPTFTRAPSQSFGGRGSKPPPMPQMSQVPTLGMPMPPSRSATVMTPPKPTMGNLIWHEYARYVAITASAYAVWASFFGLFYRKFFWDFVTGTLRDPGGLQPSPSVAIFITLIVKAPVIPIITAIIALINLAIENPLPLLKGSSIQRSLVLRIVILVFQTFFSVLFYQGTNAALWSLIAIICYIRAIALGEKIEEAKDNRGKGGRA